MAMRMPVVDRGEPKDEPRAQYEHNARQQEGDIGSVHSQEDPPSGPVILILEPLQHLGEDTKPLYSMKAVSVTSHDVLHQLKPHLQAT